MGAMSERNDMVGERVRVTQRVVTGRSTTETVVEGAVVTAERQKSGSWFAHAKDKKVWVDRVVIRLDDGELVTVNLDQHSSVEVVGGDAAV